MAGENDIGRGVVGDWHQENFTGHRGRESIRPLPPQLQGGAKEHRAGELFVCKEHDER